MFTEYNILEVMKSIAMLIFVSACCLLDINIAEAKRSKEPAQPQINQKAIQEGVMSLADSWVSGVSQGYQSFESQLQESPGLRVSAKQMKFAAMSSAVEIAIVPYPGRALLDLMVLSSLSKDIWERHWLSTYGAPAQQLADTYSALEKEIWDFAAKFASPEQRDELRSLIDRWLADHPEATAANFVRFSDFGSLRNVPALVEATKPGGWLSTLRSAADTANQMQEFSERALYLTMRMQALIATRLELSVAESLSFPEINQLFNDVSGFRQVAEDYAVLIEKLPSDLTKEIDTLITDSLVKVAEEREAILTAVSIEREAALNQILEGISQERSAALVQTLEGLETERDAVLKTITAVVLWSDLQAKAMFNRVFVLVGCLVLLYFLLRLVYRYMRAREPFTAGDMIKTVLLLLITAIPVIALGVWCVDYTMPDKSRLLELEAEFSAVETELPE